MLRACIAMVLGLAALDAGSPAIAQVLLVPAMIADSMPAPLTATPGDPAKGRAIAFSRDAGNCSACHAMPSPGPSTSVQPQSDFGPRLSGIGARLSEGQIRLRVVDYARINARTLMPSYYKVEGLINVGKAYGGRPVLEPQGIEDVVAFLASLKTEAPKP